MVHTVSLKLAQPARRTPGPDTSSCAQADVISRVDEQLRAEMVEMQTQVARWVTEQKACADTVALKGQRLLEKDKGTISRRRRLSPGTVHLPVVSTLTRPLVPCRRKS